MIESSSYTGAPDECSAHWPRKVNECPCAIAMMACQIRQENPELRALEAFFEALDARDRLVGSQGGWP